MRITSPLSFLISITFSSYSMAGATSDTTIFSAGIGHSHYLNPYHHTLDISPIIHDQLDEHHHHEQPSLTIGVKYFWHGDVNGIQGFSLGPALYYQKLQSTGDVLELGSPSLNNYQYTLNQIATSLMIEGSIYFTPHLKAVVSPFVKAGFGLSLLSTGYHDLEKPLIPANSAMDLGTRLQLNPTYLIAVGLQFSVGQSYAINIEESYLHAGSASTNKSLTPRLDHALDTALNSFNTFITFTYSA